ncbi:MAG: ABC-F family ATP-binding cassette domain-containing protein, partial [Pirellulaceae bacterium]|nr:ABC-F family ATP-binding cassette domain-containing protein [Pirellulaceae bacterium]
QPADGGRTNLVGTTTIGYLEQHPTFAPTDTLWSVAADAVGDIVALANDAEQIAHQLSECTDQRQRERLLERLDYLQARLQHSDAYHWENRVERTLQGLGFTRAWFERPAASLSGGQQNRLMLAHLLLKEPELMILDEPNNHLDIESTEWLETTLSSWPGAFLLVSHDRFFLDQVTSEVWELVDAKLDHFRGNYSAYVRQKTERLEVQRRTFEKQRDEIEKLEDFIRKHHAGQKSTQAEDRRKKLERIEAVEQPREIHTPKFRFPPATRTGDIVLRVKDFKKAYDRVLFDKLSFQVERGQRFAILGSNGSGKSTLLKCLLGEVQPDAGTVTLGANVRVGYFDQLLKQLDMDMTPMEAVRVPNKDMVDKERRDILAAFGLIGEVVLKPLRMLSGGERNRVMLARLSALEANLLILDEPTNHLDLWSRQALEQAVRSFDGTVLLVTHDRYLVNAIADHVLVLRDGRASLIDGNYDNFRHWMRQGMAVADRGQVAVSDTRTAARQSTGSGNGSGSGTSTTGTGNSNANAITNAAQGATKAKRKRKFPYRKVADLEADIMQVEGEIDQMQQRLIDPQVLRDGRLVKEVQQQLTEHESRLANLYEHYEEACELN